MFLTCVGPSSHGYSKPLEGEFETLLIWLGEPKKKAVKIQSVQLRLCL